MKTHTRDAFTSPSSVQNSLSLCDIGKMDTMTAPFFLVQLTILDLVHYRFDGLVFEMTLYGMCC
jgi:hypothetical protein